MITLTLDTSCFKYRVQNELNELKKLQKQGKIQAYVFSASFWEKMQINKAEEKPIQLSSFLKKLQLAKTKEEREELIKYRIQQLNDLSYMMSFDDNDRYAKNLSKVTVPNKIVTFKSNEIERVYQKVREIHSQELRGKRIRYLNDR
ncbi:MAG: hypothetical protein U9O96_02435 [Candidatus Thermoplasmatota archaeon]|nr:hypothetical protein [Candidatus Thermoplasmatota archaeon]